MSGPLAVTMPALSCPRCCRREKTVVGQDRGVRMTENGENAALVHWVWLLRR